MKHLKTGHHHHNIQWLKDRFLNLIKAVLKMNHSLNNKNPQNRPRRPQIKPVWDSRDCKNIKKCVGNILHIRKLCAGWVAVADVLAKVRVFFGN